MGKLQTTANAGKWHKKFSTWLSAAAVALGACARAYEELPADWQQAIPPEMSTALAILSLLCVLLVPAATSVSQASLRARE